VISKDDACAILFNFLAKVYPNRHGDAEIVINDDITEREYGWLFTYTTAAFRRTRDPRKALIGAGPALVLRRDGRIVEFPSVYSPEQALSEYENYPHKFSSSKDA
jgi:hypothetical protein